MWLLNGSRIVAVDENDNLLIEICPMIAGTGLSVQNLLQTPEGQWQFRKAAEDSATSSQEKKHLSQCIDLVVALQELAEGWEQTFVENYYDDLSGLRFLSKLQNNKPLPFDPTGMLCLYISGKRQEGGAQLRAEEGHF